jgi:AcrR family transcriptional regulator
MATRETQAKITSAALELFNQFGSASVSFDKIAAKAGISKGNLHYHFSSKEQIVMALWSQLDKKINHAHYPLSDLKISNISDMLMGHFKVIWDYRFIYSELNFILAKDSDLQYHFVKERKHRLAQFSILLKAVAHKNLLQPGVTDCELQRLVKSIWVISDYWLSYISAEGKEISYDIMCEGYELIAQLIRPFLIDPSIIDLPATPFGAVLSFAEPQLIAGGAAG